MGAHGDSWVIPRSPVRYASDIGGHGRDPVGTYRPKGHRGPLAHLVHPRGQMGPSTCPMTLPPTPSPNFRVSTHPERKQVLPSVTDHSVFTDLVLSTHTCEEQDWVTTGPESPPSLET